MNDYSLDRYNFELPRELIRQVPPEDRTDCRLMVLKADEIAHTSFRRVMDFIQKGDMLILNKTRVRKSLVYANKNTGGRIEITFLEKIGESYSVLVKGKIRDGESIDLFGKTIRITFGPNNKRIVEGDISWDFIESIGHLPLPPYIKRREDYQYYQNEIGDTRNSVAAPTASLHFSREMLDSLTRKGVRVGFVLLGVGYGTFKAIRNEDIRAHVVDEEEIEVTPELVEQMEDAKGNVIAVGTTVVRALETSSLPGRQVPYSGKTGIFIYPGWKFNSPVSHLLTNFHIPRSSLLSLIYAFGGEERLKSVYEVAIRNRYYFFSLGDAMLMDRYP